MKVEVIEYNGSGNFHVKIDGKSFYGYDKDTAFRHGLINISSYIIKERYGATLVCGGGTLFTDYITVYYEGDTYAIHLGHTHLPENRQHFKNVLVRHMAKFDEGMKAIIKAKECLTFEV